MQKKPRLYIIDGSSYVYRAFYAIPHLTNSRGLPTNAIYGFARMILKIIRDEKPDYLAIAFDSKGETFRHKEYAEYKAHRTEMPDELVPQIPYIHKLVEAFNIPILQNEGYEADDLIGSAVREASSKGFDVIIVSGDKDMLQLITPSIMMLDTLKNKTYGEKEVVEKFGVGPDKVVEVIGLMGDASDNIPGVPGIGEKTAIALIKEFGNIENLLNNIEKVSKPSIREKLKEHTEQALLSRRLGVINKDVELNTPVEALILKDVCIDELTELLKELEFHTLLKEILSNKDKSKREYRITTKEGDFNKLLEDKSIKKYGQNIKYETIILANEGIGLNGIDFDTEIASYLINPSSSRNQVTEIGEKASSPIKDFSLLKIEEVMNRSCEDADTAYQLKEKLEPILKEDGLIELFHKVEIPLIEVLSEMERNGVKIDEPFLREMSRRLDTQLNKLTERIYFIAGIEFNINSPKQLQEILFEKLKLKPAKRTKTGLSTDVEVLQQLSVQHDLPAIILEYRQLSKLKSTYVDALINMINPKTNRIHTSFNQTVTATGRLSSSDPNLQNIPIRTEIGREIRKSFVAESGALILSADYSEIELRILTHVSQDDVLLDAFKKNEDIHERTACEVFGVIPGMVTPEMRRMAKAVNFGIIYGISPFGLSRDLGI